MYSQSTGEKLHMLKGFKVNFRDLNIGKKYAITIAVVFILFGISTAVVSTLIGNIGENVNELE
ncbi:hypothetical protein [Virgibacillus sp. DJP39]|uniref:hypothetical protein n=1 Tax=Virgibacillus sp. DJP39 TaxID=3409790 RepID=UPI003BB48F57